MADITLAWMMDQLAGHSSHPTRTTSPSFRPLDWIKFDTSYIHHLYTQQVKYYSTTGGGTRGWGLGRVYDSSVLPGSLILGAKTRVPGRYHRSFYKSGKIDPRRRLLDTGEMVHASVRVRVRDKGRGFERQDGLLAGVSWVWRRIWDQGSVVAYRPMRAGGPLEGWRFEVGQDGSRDRGGLSLGDGNSSESESCVKWVWTDEQAVEQREMLEDRLGEFERLLLEKDPMAGGLDVGGGIWANFKGMLDSMEKAQTL